MTQHQTSKWHVNPVFINILSTLTWAVESQKRAEGKNQLEIKLCWRKSHTIDDNNKLREDQVAPVQLD